MKQISSKPDKPIDYLQILKNKRNKRNESISKNEEYDKMLYDFEEDRIKCEKIENKISEKKVFLKLNGGLNLNPMLGDEIGNLLIESMKNKLKLLKKYQEE